MEVSASHMTGASEHVAFSICRLFRVLLQLRVRLTFEIKVCSAIGPLYAYMNGIAVYTLFIPARFVVQNIFLYLRSESIPKHTQSPNHYICEFSSFDFISRGIGLLSA